MNELDEALYDFLTESSSKILKCDNSDILWEADVDEYGFDSMKVNQLCVDINEFFSIQISPAVFLENGSLEALSQYLKDHFYGCLEDKLLSYTLN